MTRKHGLLLFISACIPGCGQMYQGYMKRGVSLLAAGCLVIALSSVLHLGELSIFLPLLWLFAFFDTYNIRNQTDEQARSNPDRWLINLSSADNGKLTTIFKGKNSIVGWTLVALGAVALYNTIASRWFYGLCPEWLSRILTYDIPRVVVIAAIIALGIWFIRGTKVKASNEEFTAFTSTDDNMEGKNE